MSEKVTETLTEIDHHNSMEEVTCFSSDAINCWHNIQNFVDLCISRRHQADSGYCTRFVYVHIFVFSASLSETIARRKIQGVRLMCIFYLSK